MRIASGIVQQVDYGLCLITVTIEGLEDYSIKDVHVVQGNTYENKSLNMPSIGETVVCIISDDDITYCIGGIYSEINTSQKSSENLSLILKDGTYINYDFKSKNLECEVKGNISAKCKSFSAEASDTITVKAPKIVLDGEVETTANVKTSGNIETTDIKASGIGFLSHIHSTPDGPSGPVQSGGA